MKRVLLVATAIAGLAFAAPSLAQSNVNGTVNVSGTVADRCTVTADGAGATGTGASFTGTIALGELTQTNGTLNTTLSGSTSPIPGDTISVTVVCTGGSENVSLSATQLSAGLGAPPATFADAVNYTAELDLDKAAGGTGTFTYNTATATGPTTGALGGQLSSTANNVRVSAYSFNTVGGNTLTLEAGTYNGVISVGVGPTI